MGFPRFHREQAGWPPQTWQGAPIRHDFSSLFHYIMQLHSRQACAGHAVADKPAARVF